MTIQEDLDTFLSDAPALDETPPIPDDGAEALDQADRYLRGLYRLDRDEAQLKAVADRQRKRIATWLEDRTAGIPERRAHLTMLLEGFTRAWKARTRKNPPKLPTGSLRLTPPRVSVLVTDEEAFRDWAEGNERLDLLRIKIEPNLNAIKDAAKEGPVTEVKEPEEKKRYHKAMTPEGEPIPGITLVTPTEDSFTVKVAATEPEPEEEEE